MLLLAPTPITRLAFAFLPCAVALNVAAALASPAAAGSPPKSAAPSCWSALAHTEGPRMTCEHAVWMTDEERDEVKKLTRGYLLDARCKVKVDVDANLVSEGLAATNRTIDLPPQPVTCDLQTSGGAMTVGGTFAPHVVIKDGFATTASPGLANITGVNSYLAWPVVAYVNHSSSITVPMAQMINEIRSAKLGRQARN